MVHRQDICGRRMKNVVYLYKDGKVCDLMINVEWIMIEMIDGFEKCTIKCSEGWIER
jgi:hypothetical protein